MGVRLTGDTEWESRYFEETPTDPRPVEVLIGRARDRSLRWATRQAAARELQAEFPKPVPDLLWKIWESRIRRAESEAASSLVDARRLIADPSVGVDRGEWTKPAIGSALYDVRQWMNDVAVIDAADKSAPSRRSFRARYRLAFSQARLPDFETLRREQRQRNADRFGHPLPFSAFAHPLDDPEEDPLQDRIEDRGPGTEALAMRGVRDCWWLSQFRSAERGLLLLWARRGRRCERRDCVRICHVDHRGRPYPRLKPWAQKRLERLRQQARPDARALAWPLAEEMLRAAVRVADRVGKVASTVRCTSERDSSRASIGRVFFFPRQSQPLKQKGDDECAA